MFGKRKWQIGMGAVVGLLVVPLLIAMGYDQSGAKGDGTSGRDAESYADDYGVTVEEARRRLDLQVEAGKLGASLAANESATFGGLWIEHTPEYVVKAAFTEDGDATLQRYKKSKALAGVIESVAVDTTLNNLIAAQGSAKTSVSRTSVAAEYGVSVADNAVNVFTLDKEALKDALDKKGKELPAKARIKEVSALSAPTHGTQIHGGEHLSTCTAGFSVKNSNGTQGITTAGHCRNNQSRGGTALTFKQEWHGGSYDLQWHTGPASQTVRNLVYDGSGHRYIYSGRHWNDQAAGDYVCKYGKVTGADCGEIETKYYQMPGYVGNKWVLVRNVPGDNSDLSEQGDSGGPFFDGNVGVGIMSHEVDNTKAIYMAFNFIENVGLSLDTD